VGDVTPPRQAPRLRQRGVRGVEHRVRSLWGGGTLSGWRGRGVLRSPVAARASTEGFRYLQVNASSESRSILHRLGFVTLATTTPVISPAAST
jgi:hypothetical protein